MSGSGQLIIEISGDSTEFEDDLLTIEAKTNEVKGDVKATELTATQTLTRISQSISLIQSALTITALVTNQEIDRRFLGIISSMISLQQSISIFAAAQASMGNFAYIPLAAAFLGQIGMIISMVQQEQTTAMNLAETRDQAYLDGLDLM